MDEILHFTARRTQFFASFSPRYSDFPGIEVAFKNFKCTFSFFFYKATGQLLVSVDTEIKVAPTKILVVKTITHGKIVVNCFLR